MHEDGIARLKNLALAQDEIIKSLLTCQLPSQVLQLLRQYDLAMLILIAVQSPRAVRRQIWKYLTVWANVQPLLNGNDLKN